MSETATRPIDLILQEAEQRQGNRIFDPTEATAQLLSEVDEPMRRRALELESRYLAFHGRLSALVERLVHDESKSEVQVKMKQLDAQMARAQADMERFSLQMDAPSADPRTRQRTHQAAERHLRVVNRLLNEMRATHARATVAHVRFGQVAAELDRLWQSLRDADRIALSLAKIAAIAEMRIKALKVVLMLIMLAVAFVVDRQTPVTEGLLQTADASERHDLAIVLLFLGQAMLVEPVVAWLKKVSGWQVHQRLVKAGNDLKSRIEHIESQFATADRTLTAYEKATP